MFKITVTSDWVNVLTPRPCLEPSIVKAHNIQTFADVTAQPIENLTPSPNVLVIEAVVDQTTLDAIEADPDYLILSSEEIINEIP